MKPPKSILVMGHRYAVKVVDRDAPMKNGLMKEDAVGLTMIEEGIIQVREFGANGPFSPMSVIDTVLHESLHTIVHAAKLGVYLKPPTEDTGNSADEEFVAAFTPHLLQFIRQNPKLVEYVSQVVR